MECPPCGKKFSGLENYEQHLESEKHKKNMLCINGRQNDSSVDSGDNTSSDSINGEAIKCHVCDLSFNSLVTFQNHSASTEHALKIMLKQAKSSAIQVPNGTINHDELNTIDGKVESTPEQSLLPDLNDNKPYLSYGECKVCKKIFSGPEPYKQHLESQIHKKKVALQQNTTHLEENFKCEPCSKSFSGPVPYTQHMCSETHKKKIQNIQFVEKYLSGNSSNSQAGETGVGEKEDENNKLWFCNICQIQCSGLIPYQQHMGGSIHFKNEKRMQMLQPISENCQVDNGKNQNNFVKADSVVNSVNSKIQTNNFNEGKISEKFENMSQVMNGSNKKDNEVRQDNSLFPEKMNELKVVSSDELGELIKIISPDEEINFDEVDLLKDSSNEKPDIINQSENENSEEFRKIQESNENCYDDRLKKTEEKKEFEIYQTCKFCNVSLFDKDSAAEHFESKEHFEKRWAL